VFTVLTIKYYAFRSRQNLDAGMAGGLFSALWPLAFFGLSLCLCGFGGDGDLGECAPERAVEQISKFHKSRDARIINENVRNLQRRGKPTYSYTHTPAYISENTSLVGVAARVHL
jgi:hypothetical protein